MSAGLSRFGPAIAVMAVLFALSSVPGTNAPSAIPDEFAHTGAYAALGYALHRAIAGRPGGVGRASTVLAILGAALYGVTDEYHQSFVVGRTASSWDWGFDVLGGAIGSWLYVVVHRRSLRRTGKS